jgi:hypothetical protein
LVKLDCNMIMNECYNIDDIDQAFMIHIIRSFS